MIHYLSIEDVIELHDAALERMSAPPAPLLHPDKLESAVMRPRHAAHYENADLVRQAIMLMVGISQSQAFEDGNKRAAFVAADSFLKLNGMAYLGEPLRLAAQLEAIAEVPQGPDRDQEVDRLEELVRINLGPWQS